MQVMLSLSPNITTHRSLAKAQKRRQADHF
jgi:hypothetical protein